jgi:predicted component of type VI protein secretion system
VWAGLKAWFSEKWDALDVRKMVVDTLISIVWPWPKIGQEIQGIGTDLAAAAHGLFAPRNPMSDLMGCLHDLWSDCMKILDFPLILWRRLNNIALLLLGPITIALTIIGAIGGSLAGTVLGAIAGALAGLGIGAAPGAGGGLAVGGVAGAGAGFGVAMGLGQAFLYSFVAGEIAALIKIFIDLFSTRQTREEKAADYSTAADSALALGITGLLMLLGWVGGRVAAAAAAILRRFVPKSVLAVIDRFASGVKTAREGGPGEKKTDEPVVTEVPGKARLAADVAGSRRFAGRIRELLDKIERPDARPKLESRLQAAEETLTRIETELQAATSAADVQRLRAQREAVQADLQKLNNDVRAADTRFPVSWVDFDERFHAEFEQELRQFRGSEDLDANPGLRGGEGQLFLGKQPLQALKRWFKARLGDMAESIRLLRDARAGVQANSRLRAVLDVVEVSRTGSDWALREFDPNSVPLKNALGDAQAAAARTEAIAALETPPNATMQLIKDKLVSTLRRPGRQSRVKCGGWVGSGVVVACVRWRGGRSGRGRGRRLGMRGLRCVAGRVWVG